MARRQYAKNVHDSRARREQRERLRGPGLPHPEQELLEARLTLRIYRIIKARRVTQTQAGEILGIRQSQVSLLMRNRTGNFSVERLVEFLTALGHDVEVRVTPARKEHGQLSVVVAA